MIYPPPPYLTILAYSFGNISTDECEYMLDLWHKKHSKDDDQEVEEWQG